MHRERRSSAGFSMLEVLVTILVLSIALLGSAKMQTASLSNTQMARLQSLIAIQAGSLAAAMHGNPAYWSSGGAPSAFTVSGTTVSDAVLGAANPLDCTTVSCTPPQLATYDTQTWAFNMNQQFPSYAATVNCTTTAGIPVSCNITVSWSEKYIGINRTTSTAGGSTMTSQQTYTLYVQP